VDKEKSDAQSSSDVEQEKFFLGEMTFSGQQCWCCHKKYYHT